MGAPRPALPAEFTDNKMPTRPQLALSHPPCNTSRLKALWRACRGCGEDLSKGLRPLLTQGQLSELYVYVDPILFAGVQEDLEHSSKRRKLSTDDFMGVLVKPICRLLSSSLTILNLQGNNEVEHFTEELLTSLESLNFEFCTKLQCLPTGLHRLTNLKILRIFDCPSIRSLPKDGLPDSLQLLNVKSCGNEKLIKQSPPWNSHKAWQKL
ncbi:hypothetical protein E2562_007396 [Oryza meyeriana var. granulata]|uniref:NB-ARC domain-containing protein n=1 Tax=Oryza meyeriana var. granulata TaxID=110450 RepID=A0A6G1CYT7_9ORYZ|nr:hypothetical protein E2562_007396 [Oryza meyeriana var. granulata]